MPTPSTPHSHKRKAPGFDIRALHVKLHTGTLARQLRPDHGQNQYGPIRMQPRRPQLSGR